VDLKVLDLRDVQIWSVAVNVEETRLDIGIYISKSEREECRALRLPIGTSQKQDETDTKMEEEQYYFHRSLRSICW